MYNLQHNMKMMIRHVGIILVFFCLIIWISSCSNNKTNSDAIQKIYFDTNQSVKNFDLKNIVDSTVAIIPLETSDHCLISKIDKIEIADNCIYIQDNLAQSIYIFDMEGKYINKINRRGQGPGEYANLSYMTVTDSTIVILDHHTRKCFEYSKNTLTFLREERIFEKIWCTEVFTLPGSTYYINEWSNSTLGKYRLFSRKGGSNEFEKYLPFNEEPIGIGMSGTLYGISGNTATVVYTGDNNIYRVSAEGVYPEYEIIFKNQKVAYTPDEVTSVSGSGQVLGIRSIQESEKYLVITPSLTGNESYVCIYNKQDSTTIIYDIATSINSNSEYLFNIKKIINNQIIDWNDAPTLLVLNEYVYSKKEFKNQNNKQRLDRLFQDLTKESNPVLFIYNFN